MKTVLAREFLINNVKSVWSKRAQLEGLVHFMLLVADLQAVHA